MHIHGLKDYALPGEEVIKGIRKDAYRVGPSTFVQVQWSSLKGLVDRGDVSAPRRTWSEKKLKRNHTIKKRPAS